MSLGTMTVRMKKKRFNIKKWHGNTLIHQSQMNDVLYDNNMQLLIDNIPPFKKNDKKRSVVKQEFLWEIKNNIPIGAGSRISELSYQELLDFGFRLWQIPAKQINPTSRLRRIFSILPEDKKYNLSGAFEYTGCPDNHVIEYEPSCKAVRLLGPNSYHTDWVFKDDNAQSGEVDEDPLKWQRDFFGYSSDIETPVMKVTDLPVGIAQDGSLVCLPDSADAPVIGFVGQKGKGKTLLAHQLIDYGKCFLNKNFMILNDINNETTSWWRPGNFRLENLKFIHGNPSGIPVIFLYPNSYDLKDEDIYNHYGMGFRFTFPFKEFMMNYELYTKGSEKWALPPATSAFFDPISKEIAECKSEEEIEKVLNSHLNKDTTQMVEALRRKIKSLLALQILDLNTGVPSKWKIKDFNYVRNLDGQYNPFVASVISGGIPVFMTSKIRQHGFFLQYFYYILRDFYTLMRDDKRFKKIPSVWLFCDEITELAPKNESKQGIAFKIMETIVTEGRMNRIGFMWATQNPEMISERIYSNTTYTFIFHSRGNMADEIKHVYRLSDMYNLKLGFLKKFEFIAVTSEHFIIYDKNGGRRIHDSSHGPIICECIAPLSYHRPPESGVKKWRTEENETTNDYGNVVVADES